MHPLQCVAGISPACKSIAAESRARGPKEAQRATADAMRAVLDKLKALGLPADAIRTSGYDLQPEFDYANGRQTLRGNLAYGGGPHEWIDVDATGPAARPSTPLARNIAKRLAELFPKAAHLNVIRSWAGVIENSPDGRPILDRMTSPHNLVLASMAAVGFGLSPASGRAIRDLVIEGRCSFADLDTMQLSRFDNLEADWRERRGWLPIA